MYYKKPQGVTDALSSSADDPHLGNYLWVANRTRLSYIAHSWLPFDVSRDSVTLRKRAEQYVGLRRQKSREWPKFFPGLGIKTNSDRIGNQNIVTSLSADVLLQSGVKKRALAYKLWDAALDVQSDLQACCESCSLDNEKLKGLACVERLLALSACGLDKRLFYAAWWAGENRDLKLINPNWLVAEEADDGDPYLDITNQVRLDEKLDEDWELGS
jgi:hypothetical protein